MYLTITDSCPFQIKEFKYQCNYTSLYSKTSICYIIWEF